MDHLHHIHSVALIAGCQRRHGGGLISIAHTGIQRMHSSNGLPGTLHGSYTSHDSLRATYERICIAVNISVHTKGLARGRL